MADDVFLRMALCVCQKIVEDDVCLLMTFDVFENDLQYYPVDTLFTSTYLFNHLVVCSKHYKVFQGEASIKYCLRFSTVLSGMRKGRKHVN